MWQGFDKGEKKKERLLATAMESPHNKMNVSLQYAKSVLKKKSHNLKITSSRQQQLSLKVFPYSSLVIAYSQASNQVTAWTKLACFAYTCWGILWLTRTAKPCGALAYKLDWKVILAVFRRASARTLAVALNEASRASEIVGMSQPESSLIDRPSGRTDFSRKKKENGEGGDIYIYIYEAFCFLFFFFFLLLGWGFTHFLLQYW